ncbi:MAG TPA: TonB-dependent receptor [Longimicrobiales bacterium]|nr:TonB-dependent receptor [Longimicrobiales bacterium]
MHIRTAARPLRLGVLMLRLTRPLALAALAIPTATLEAQVPDSAVLHRPILVRAALPFSVLGAPRPIATLTGAELSDGRAAVFLEEVVQALPGVQIQNRYNFAVGERLSVRGFGGRAQFGVRGVRILVDGVPATLPDGQSTLDHLDVATLGRVEALRGPAASLYGNAAGGVLHFETRQPATAVIRPELFTMTGSDGMLQLRGTVDGTVAGLGYLISAARIHYDGFRRDSLPDDGNTYGAARRSSLNTTLHLPGGPGRLRATINALDLAAENPGSLARAVFDTSRQAFINNVRVRTRKDVRQGQLGLSWDGPVGATAAEVAAYGLLRTVDNPIPSDIIVLDRSAFGARALVDVPAQLADRAFGIGGGVELDLQRDDRQNYANSAGGRGALRLDQLERVRATGIFGYARLQLLTTIGISAGLRYDRFHFDAQDRFVTADPDDSGERDMAALSPSFGITFEPAPRIGMFASITTSFETPSTTELANRPEGAGGFNPELDPQRGTTYEGGVRSFVAHQTYIELTAHRTTLRDELVPFEVQGVPGRTFFSNAGRSTHRGFEVALHSAPLAALSGRISYSWLDARFEEYRRGANVFDGNRIPGMAPHSLDAVLRAAHHDAFAEVRTQYRGAVPADDANSAEAPPHFLLDVRAGSNGVRIGSLELAPVAGINNVLDRRYAAAVTVNAFGGRFFEPGPSRTYHVGLRTRVVGR